MTGAKVATTAGSGMNWLFHNDQLIAEYLDDTRLQGLTVETIDDYRSNLGIFANYHSKSLLELTIPDLRNFLVYLMEERKVHVKTISRYFSAISSFYDYMVFSDQMDANIVLPFRKRYVGSLVKKLAKSGVRRQIISVEQARSLIQSILDPRDKAINVLLAKTGIRRGELASIDLEDIDWHEQSLRLKHKAKRTNLTVYFDDEASRTLKRWVRVRKKWFKKDADARKALFINQRGVRLARSGVYDAVVNYAIPMGLHDPHVRDPSKRFTPHCYRHFFTTHLRRNGMKREYIKELRGDARHEAIDIYHHIDSRDLREAYLAAIPRLGI